MKISDVKPSFKALATAGESSLILRFLGRPRFLTAPFFLPVASFAGRQLAFGRQKSFASSHYLLVVLPSRLCT